MVADPTGVLAEVIAKHQRKCLHFIKSSLGLVLDNPNLAAMMGGKRSTRLVEEMMHEAQQPKMLSLFSDDQKITLRKIAACLELRIKSLQSPDLENAFLLEQLEQIYLVLQNIMLPCQDFPFDVTPLSAKKLPKPKAPKKLDSPRISGNRDGTLLPRLKPKHGRTLLTIKIVNIGLKDAALCVDPYITITVRDVCGTELTTSQDTPFAVNLQGTCLNFQVDVEIQLPVEDIPTDAAIFFELKHYKPLKRLTSTKCFALLEMDEIRPGAAVIELYKKPTDYRRKKLQLLTKKSLYLHIHQTLLHTA
ncbi:axin interactor, dorsalization-associated protein-like isoform X3 [Lethenteron reissneri]|uniref:axin interactor, dorsalization-associated protein-like isoform X3 n=1 Tax=Lethenteron reissneri TaxID=7753 RepID=UPI002AB61DB7|nr:axin interactor, dorsalization-associated protein-like isoform X3 [Lethenteron reissneri]